jgi:hypothetical protein
MSKNAKLSKPQAALVSMLNEAVGFCMDWHHARDIGFRSATMLTAEAKGAVVVCRVQGTPIRVVLCRSHVLPENEKRLPRSVCSKCCSDSFYKDACTQCGTAKGKGEPS